MRLGSRVLWQLKRSLSHIYCLSTVPHFKFIHSHVYSCTQLLGHLTKGIQPLQKLGGKKSKTLVLLSEWSDFHPLHSLWYQMTDCCAWHPFLVPIQSQCPMSLRSGQCAVWTWREASVQITLSHLSDFFPDGSDLVQDDNAPIHSVRGASE